MVVTCSHEGVLTMPETNHERLVVAAREIDKALLETFKGLSALLKRKYGFSDEQLTAVIAKAQLNSACAAFTATLPAATVDDGLKLRAKLSAAAAEWWDNIVERERTLRTDENKTHQEGFG